MSPEERRKAIEQAWQLITRVAMELKHEDQDAFAAMQCDRAMRALGKVLKHWEREGSEGGNE